MEINLSWLMIPCGLIGLAVFFGLLAIAINYRVRSGLRYPKQMNNAIARGAFNDMNTHRHKRRFRWLAGIALIGVLALTAIIGLMALRILGLIDVPISLLLIPFGIFGGFAGIAGLSMQREINRRL
ncbi:MAG TPA: hypothetical protein VK249_25670 [Anaerolineales bacterium]|nr:hypothetical protein [Anaerolineales bacterium]